MADDYQASDPAAEASGDKEGAGDDSFYLPPNFPGADSIKEGDTITLTVVGKDGDGNIEVKSAEAEAPVAGGEQQPMMEDLAQTLKG